MAGFKGTKSATPAGDSASVQKKAPKSQQVESKQEKTQAKPSNAQDTELLLRPLVSSVTKHPVVFSCDSRY